ncbi:MAG TPA: glycosyltransferase family A protein [Vicinamibacterales bacterium]|nr:glycosyltransferase family A protein [Vicinamibacterales bacterium]
MSDAAPRVSVIIPLFNKAPYIRRCLESALAQTLRPFEVVVVDDGSTDDSASIVEEYRAREPRIRLLRQHNSGPGAARNHAAAEASGELLAMLDADDEWKPTHVAETVRTLVAYPNSAALFRAAIESPWDVSSGERWRQGGVESGPCRLTPNVPAGFLNAIVAAVGTSGVVIRKREFDEVGGFYSADRCRFGEDTHLWVKLLLNYEVTIACEPLVHRHCEVSELAIHWKGVRPIEPFLSDDRDLVANCPAKMRPVLREFLALRACKTASVYGYVGQHSRARDLVRRFVAPADWHLPWFFVALISCTPAAKWLAAVVRISGINLRQQRA